MSKALQLLKKLLLAVVVFLLLRHAVTAAILYGLLLFYLSQDKQLQRVHMLGCVLLAVAMYVVDDADGWLIATVILGSVSMPQLMQSD